MNKPTLLYERRLKVAMGLSSGWMRLVFVLNLLPIVAKTGQRFYCNLVFAIANNGRMFFSNFKAGFNSAAFISFLGRLIRIAGKEVLLVLDAHPVYQAKKVKTWLQDHKGKIEFVFLPAYAPQSM